MIRKKNNRTLENTQQEKIPKGWIKTKIDNICELIGGGTPSRQKSEYFNGDIIWLTPTEIPKNQIIKINNSREKITELGLKKSSAKIIPINSVLLTSRANIGYVAIAGTEVTTNQGFASFVCNKTISPYFLAYWLFGNKNLLKSKAVGTTFKEISKSKLRELEFKLPPLLEQHRIVLKIESIFTQIDATRDRLLKIQSKLKSGPVSLQALRSSILKQAFEGKLVPQDPNDESAEVLLKRIHKDYKKELVFEMDHLPKGWLVTAIHNIGIVITGNTPNKKTTSYYGDYIAFFKPTDLNSGYYVKTSTEKLSKEGLTKARLIPKKSILVTSIGATIGKVGFSRISGTTNQQINSIIPNTKIIFPEYLYFICVSPQFQKSLLGDASATTLPIINKSKFSKLMISLPPLNEQKRIVAKIESIFDKIDAKQEEMKKIEVQIKSISDSINTLKNSILKQAFEGKLVLQDPNDEHASVLLGRVKSQKSKTI